MVANCRTTAISRYRFVDQPDGFIVIGDDATVRVRLLLTNWEVWTHKDGPRSAMAIPLYEFGLVLGNVVCKFHSGRERARRLGGGNRAAAQADWANKREQRQIRRSVGSRVNRRLRRLLSQVDPLMLAIQRATQASRCDAQASTEYYVSVLPDVTCIQDPQARRDILTYRAAAIAAGHLTELVPAWLRRVAPELADAPASALKDPATRTAIAARHPFLASEAGLALMRQWMIDRSLRMSATLVEALRFWRDLFSWSCVSDEPMKHTLTHLPEDVTDFLVCALPNLPLRRPLTDRLELFVTALVARRRAYRHRNDPALDPNADVFLDARHDEIVRAMHLVSVYFGWTLEPKYTGHISAFVDFVLRNAETHRDSLEGLAEEAIVSDLRALERVRNEVVAELGASTTSVRPPIPLPDDPRIHFLATVQEIADVGVELGSRLAWSARRAVEGDWFLFRVDHNGAKEAVRVGRDGLVALPPYSDRRMTWGEKTLEAWAAGFRPPPRPYVGGGDDPF